MNKTQFTVLCLAVCVAFESAAIYYSVVSYMYTTSKMTDLLQAIIYAYDYQANLSKQLQNDTAALKQEIDILYDTNFYLNNALTGLYTDFERLESKYAKLSGQKGGVPVKTEEVKTFLGKDTTNEREYNRHEYDCCFFSKTLMDSAKAKGMETHLTLLYFDKDKSAHCIVAFNTTDNGLIFVEPQDDNIFYSLEVGDSYSLNEPYKITRMLII